MCNLTTGILFRQGRIYVPNSDIKTEQEFAVNYLNYLPQ